jgi:predicted aldo/keto reductase-like oxidoreductase
MNGEIPCRRFGKTNIRLSALGVGTNRFKTNTKEEIAESIEVVKKAVESGINYIDVAQNYSNGKGEYIVNEALKQTDKKPHITVKVSYMHDKTEESAYRRVLSALANLGLKKATFFVVWTIMNYAEFIRIIEKGGLYDGALKAKQDGLVGHICASLHAPPGDMLKIMESGLFDGITISYSLLNQKTMEPVLFKAKELSVGIVSMNSLGGGLIPQNQDFFSFCRQQEDKTINQSALKYAYAHPEITTMLSGMASLKELEENIEAVSQEESLEDARRRIAAVEKNIKNLKGFCTACKYCDGCPSGINISMMMQSYNTLFFGGNASLYNRSDKKLLENIGVCKTLKDTYQYIPENIDNPCVKCGACEKKCTQSIPIINRIEELYGRFGECGFSEEYIKERILEIFRHDYRKIAFYPGGGYTAVVMERLKRALPSLDAELFLFDSNRNSWGKFTNGIEIRNPEKIMEIKPDIMVVSNYKYADEIYDSICFLENNGIKVVKLHKPEDVPWQY